MAYQQGSKEEPVICEVHHVAEEWNEERHCYECPACIAEFGPQVGPGIPSSTGDECPQHIGTLTVLNEETGEYECPLCLKDPEK